MITATWIVVGILAALNLLAGAGKAFTPWRVLQQNMPWTASVGKPLSYIAAWAEVVGAVGLVIAAILARIADGSAWLNGVAVVAAVGLTLIQVLAIGVHVRRKELKNLPVNVILIALGIAAVLLLLQN